MLRALEAVVFRFHFLNHRAVPALVAVLMHKPGHPRAAVRTVHKAGQQRVVLCLLRYPAGLRIFRAPCIDHLVCLLEHLPVNDLQIRDMF